MKNMRVILREDVPNLGRTGEVVAVRSGYGRNFLIPQGKAVLATTRNVKRLEHEKRVVSSRAQRVVRDAQELAERLATASVTVQKNVGEGDRIFGSVTTREISEALREEGLEVDRRKIVLSEPIRALGIYPVEVKLAPGIVGQLKVWVVASERRKESREETAPQ